MDVKTRLYLIRQSTLDGNPILEYIALNRPDMLFENSYAVARTARSE